MSITPTPSFSFGLMSRRTSRSRSRGRSLLQHDMVGAQQVEEFHKPCPAARLDALAAVVAEAEMDGGLVRDSVEDAVDRLRRELGVLGAAWKVGLVDLDARRFDGPHLRG